MKIMVIMKYPKIKFAEPLKDYKLFLIFDNGIIKIYGYPLKVGQLII